MERALTPSSDSKVHARNGHGEAGESRSAPARRSRRVMNAHLATTARIVFIVLALITFAYQAATVVIPIVLALFLSMMFKPPVRWLVRARLPVPLAATLVMIVAGLTIATGVMYLGKPATLWINAAPDNFTRIKEKFRDFWQPAARLSAAASKAGTLETPEDANKRVQAVEVKDNRLAHIVFSWTGGLLTGIGETIGLVFLLLAFGDSFVNRLVESLPVVPNKKRALQITLDVQHNISTYLFTVGLINLCFGIVIGVVLHFLGMPNATMWGGVAAAANFIPYFGPILGIAAVVAAGLLGFDDLGHALAPAGAYLLLHLTEANYLTPLILGKRFTLNPVVIFVSLIFWAWLWGVIGALLAVPILVAVKAACDHLPDYASFRDLISNRSNQAGGS